MCSLGFSWLIEYSVCIRYYARLINNAYCMSFVCCQLLLLCNEVVVVESSEFSSQSTSESRLAAVDLSVSSANKGQQIAMNGASGLAHSAVIRLRGFYAVLGPTSDVEGFAKGITENKHALEDYRLSSNLSENEWIDIISDEGTSTTCSSDNTDCLSVLDRVQRAVLLGASAIIILAMNPKVLRELTLLQVSGTNSVSQTQLIGCNFLQLDAAQLFSRPLIIIEDVNNITAMLTALKTKLKLRIRITQLPPERDPSIQTYTVWSACWRASPGSGVICRSDSQLSKANPSLFWSYFYSSLAVVMLLLLLKCKRQENDDENGMFETSVGKIALLAVSTMKMRRYRKLDGISTSSNDMCAICLEQFCNRQKIRVLPCVHEFHCRCVDQWLVKHKTCPLCKLDVIDLQISRNSLFSSSNSSLAGFNISVM